MAHATNVMTATISRAKARNRTSILALKVRCHKAVSIGNVNISIFHNDSFILNNTQNGWLSKVEVYYAPGT